MVDNMFDAIFNDLINNNRTKPVLSEVRNPLSTVSLHSTYKQFDDRYVYCTPVIGCSSDDVSVEFRDGFLIVDAKSETNLGKFDFSKKISVNFDIINVKKIKAEVKDGILSITLPLKETEKMKEKTIKIL